jgi:hypothetical protein
MDVLNLALVGWLFTAGCAIALGLGIWLIVGLHLNDEGARKHLAARVLDDSFLFGIWIMGLAGGIGVLLGKSWSLWVLELFCWTLGVLVLLSSFNRWRAAPRPRGLLRLSLVLFAFPVLALCAATILTLRSETALRALAA